MKVIREWADWRLNLESIGKYRLYHHNGFYMTITATGDDAALEEVAKIVRENEYSNQADTGHINQAL